MFMRSSYIRFVWTMKEFFLTECWLLKMTHFANHQLFRQKGHKQEDLLRFLSCQLRFIRVLGLADDRSAHEITKLLRTACPAWKSILDLTNLATLLKTAAYQSEQLAELLQVGQRGSLGSVLDSDLVRKLTSLGFAQSNLHLGGPARNFFFLRLNRSARACLAISDGDANAPLSSTFITELEDMVEDKPNLYAAPAVNKDELYVHNDVMQQVYANTTKGSYTRNSTKPPFAKQDGVHTPTSQKPPLPC
jgi:hypothetical protein